ncbi:MAG: ABC transporter ATP-binding protein [Spirochaetes bacterium RBG_13_51_14]|nr:MAG: ABC transporter ATP-binding protein [Spirochaetes bacterium RBG_13_51_14]
MEPILEVKDLKKHFPEVKAVDGISFSIEPGICFGLLGPNGAGKTTAIEVIEGILRPTAGEIFYKGGRRGSTFKNEVGIQFQNTELPQFLTVKETLLTFRNLYDRAADMDYLITTCRLEEILTRDNRKISGGQKQRLLLAMALANDPELIFLDEPTTGLDPQARRHLWEIVRQIKSQKKTIVLTTHYMEEAEILCDRIGIIDNGRIIAMGSPRGLLEEHCAGATITINLDLDDGLLKSFPCQWFRKEGRIEIQTQAVNECLRRLVTLGIDLSTMNVRMQNLEDLFLKLTGHELRA